MQEQHDIVCVGPCADIYKGGIAQFFSALARTLGEVRSVKFLTWSRIYPGILSNRDFVDSVSAWKLNLSDSQGILDYYNPFTLIKLVREITDSTSHLILNWAHPVHAPHYFIVSAFVRLFRSARIVLICHNVEPHEPFWGSQLLTKIMFHLADKIVVHSRNEARKAADLIDRSKVIELFHPVFDFFKPTDSNDTQFSFRLLFFGFIRPYKGVDLLLEGFSKARRKLPQLELVIAGESFQNESIDSELKFQIEQLGLSDSVTLMEKYISNEEVSVLFSNTDALVLPFRSVSQSGSLTIAFAHHKPAIVSSLEAFTDLVEEGKTGCVCDVGSAESLASAIERFYSYTPMTDNIISLKNQLSWTRYVKELLRAIEPSLNPT
jgi:glycosyltransferase involved in cell wall biosynthesis